METVVEDSKDFQQFIYFTTFNRMNDGDGGDVVRPAVVNEYLQRKQEARNNKLRVKNDLGIAGIK